MNIYLVGGAIRDELLGLSVTERDWVVIGSTPEEMLTLGYQPVGKDFPVFLHPKTHEEYALARTERKTGKGYKGFIFHTDPNVSIEEDLKRRDLTINAIARNEQGELIDPYHGQQDLKNKILRHVSEAFAEDPVRILRVARFAAKLPHFTVNPTTQQLMRQMVHNGEVDALVTERVWQEMHRALYETAPMRFFEVLNACGALAVLFPSLKKNIPDINMAHLNAEQRFAFLLHQLTTADIKSFCTQYKVPTDFSEPALLVNKLSSDYKTLNIRDPHALLSFLKQGDALRRPQRFMSVIQVLAHIHHVDHLSFLQHMLHVIKHVDTKPLQEKGLKNKEFSAALEELQINAIKNEKTQSP